MDVLFLGIIFLFSILTYGLITISNRLRGE